MLQCRGVLQSKLSGQEQCRKALLLCQDVLQPTVMLSVNARVPTDDDAATVPTDDAAITPTVAPSMALASAVVLPQAPHGSSKEAETDDRSSISSSSSLGDGTFGREEGQMG